MPFSQIFLLGKRMNSMNSGSDSRQQNEEAHTLLSQRQTKVESSLATKSESVADNRTVLNKDVTCGFWIFKSNLLQKCATETLYMILYGTVGCMLAMTFAYFNGTMTTIEKRYKIPSRIIGLVSVGNDISSMLTSVFLGYFIGGKHRPRWMGLGMLSVVAYCLLTALPHFIYGGGEDALKLTHEYGGYNVSDRLQVTNNQKDRILCSLEPTTCMETSGSIGPQVLLFVAQFVLGIGTALFYTLGIAYMDDNTTKSKSPAMLTWSSFLRMLGPAIGYAMASFCLQLYIEPDMNPVITDSDPRWLGAWWLGFLLLAIIMLVCGALLFMFPKELPRTRARRIKAAELNDVPYGQATDLSLQDMISALKRLTYNKVYMYNNLAAIFFCFGYMPYWMFLPKYIEIEYRQTAATSSMVTGSVALAFAATSVLISGYVITKYKPSARAMMAWNCIVNVLTITGVLAYMFIGCEGSDSVVSLTTDTDCSAACHCDYVHFTPVCGEDNVTYISPCHVGCSIEMSDADGLKTFSGCTCLTNATGTSDEYDLKGLTARSGLCPVDCFSQFVVFMVVMCLLKIVVPSTGSTGLLIALRCVEPRDKAFAMGFETMLLSLFSLIPSPVFFGWLMDQFCLVWGKTCSTQGNCWLYDAKGIRYAINLIAAALILVSTIFSIPLWYYAKDVQIFDEEPDPKNSKANIEMISIENS